jgi:hypothetical protein
VKADFVCGLFGGVAEPPAVPLGCHGSAAGAGGTSARNCSEGVGRSTTMSTMKLSEVAPFSVQAPDYVGGADNTIEEYVVRDAGVHGLGIHRPPIPFMFFLQIIKMCGDRP